MCASSLVGETHTRRIGMPMGHLYNRTNASAPRTGPVITELNSDEEDDETLLPPDPTGLGPTPPKLQTIYVIQ